VTGSRRKRIVFALAAALLPFVLLSFALLATDIYLHRRFARTGGFNVWGYRGPIASRKAADEYRAVMLGGSTVFGYGVPWDEAIPRQLEVALRQRARRPMSVVNLGYNNEGAYSFAFTLADYKYLKYDLVILYEGYNDMMGDPNGPNLSVFRHDSPVFRLTGYLPIFPLVFREKAAVLLTGSAGSLYAASRDNRTVFRPGLATRTTAEILNAAAGIGESLERQLGRVSAEPQRQIDRADDSGCRAPWAEYCRSVQRAVRLALDMNRQVLVVGQPLLTFRDLGARHRSQQTAIAEMIASRFGGDPRVRFVDIGSSVSVSDPALSFDQMHLTAAGNRAVAAALVEPVLQMAAAQSSARAR